MSRLLIVDDEPSMRELLQILFEQRGYEVDVAASVGQAIGVLESQQPDLIMSDLNMEGPSGLDFLRFVRSKYGQVPFIVVTAFGSQESAEDALQLGADDYVLKPFDNNELLLVVQRQLGQTSRSFLKPVGGPRLHHNLLVGESPEMTEVYDVISRVSNSRISCLIYGEQGTGKATAARAIHQSGPRCDEPFITLNCGAVPDHLFEQELYGTQNSSTETPHVRRGLLALAKGGTLFLDEVDALPLAIQSKLFRTFQERSYRDADGHHHPVDVRLLSATDRSLDELVADGTFREELYYLLNVVQLRLPPLRERRMDIPLLVQHIVQRFSLEYGKNIIGIAPPVHKQLRLWDYPGNVRELRNILERAVALCPSNILQLNDLPTNIQDTEDFLRQNDSIEFPEEGINLDELLFSIEREWLLAALQHTNWNKANAAAVLRTTLRSLRYRLSKHNIGQDG